MLRIRGDFFNFQLSYITGIILFEVLDTIIYVVSGALGEHLDGTIRQIADKTSELVAVRHPVSGKTKTDALNPTDENDVPGNHFLTND
jgi:hypothetical protein